jgi:hypothetical protein
MHKNWVDSQVYFLTKVVRSHDRDLFAERSHLGHINIMRKSKRVELAYSDESQVLQVYKETAQLVFPLTENWTVGSRPVDWGSEVVLNRLKQHDSWNNERLLKEIEESEEKARVSKERDRRNQDEAWLADNHSKFKKSFSDVRVANFDKSERRRRRYEKNLEIKS